MNTYSYTTRISDDWAEIRISGKMDPFAATRIITEGTAIIKAGFPTLILNMKEVEYISSAGLRAIIALHKKITEIPGGEVHIEEPSSFVASTLKMAGMDSLLQIDTEPRETPTQFLDVTATQNDDHLILFASGSLNVFSVKWVVEETQTRIMEGVKDITLDAENITYMSSAGIRTLLLVNKNVTAVQGKFKLHNPSAPIREVLKIAGLESFITQS